MLVRWSERHRTEFVLVLDAPTDVQHRLQKLLASMKQLSPYEYLAVFADEVKNFYNSSVWSLRDFVRDVEIVRSVCFYLYEC